MSELKGKWFHSVDEAGDIHWQGQFIDFSYGTGRYLAQLYSFADGCTSRRVELEPADVQRWHIYDTNQDMMQAWVQDTVKQRWRSIIKAVEESHIFKADREAMLLYIVERMNGDIKSTYYMACT